MAQVKTLPAVLSVLVIVLFTGAASAQTLLVDPQIPDGEKASYTSQIAGSRFTVENTVKIKKEGGREFYEITSLSKRQDKGGLGVTH